MLAFADSFFPRLERELNIRGRGGFEMQVLGSLSRRYKLPVRDHLNVEHTAEVSLTLHPEAVNAAANSRHGLIARIVWKEDDFQIDLRKRKAEQVQAMSPMKTVDRLILAIFDYEHKHADDFQKDQDAKEREEEIQRRTLTDAKRLASTRARQRDRKKTEKEAFETLKANLPDRMSASRVERGFAVSINCGSRGAHGLSPEDMLQLAQILTVWSRGKLKRKRGT